MTEYEKGVMSGLVDLLDDLVQGTDSSDTMKDYYNLRRQAMELTGEA